jgi:hypothetical protein
MRPTKRNKNEREQSFKTAIQLEVNARKRRASRRKRVRYSRKRPIRPTKRKKRRGTRSRDTESIPSKARSEAAIQLEASAIHPEETDKTDEEKEKERELRIRMYSVESLLESRHSVGSETEKEKEQAEENDKEK